MLLNRSRIWTAPVLCLFAVAGLARGEGVRIVDDPSAVTYTSLQAAVDAAVDGDVLLVQPGTYASLVIDDKELTLLTVDGGTALLASTIEVHNLALSRSVVMAGFEASGVAPGEPGLLLVNNAGHVRLQQCRFTGALGAMGYYPGGDGAPGALLLQNKRVAFVDCQLTGGAGFGKYSGPYDSVGGNGGDAVFSEGTAVALRSCEIVGGEGGAGGEQGGHGGHGFHLLDFGVFAAGSVFRGGAGGDGWDFVFSCGGDGGDGLVVEGGQAQLLDNQLTGGEGGRNFAQPCEGAPGAGISGSGVVNQYNGSSRTLQAARVTSDAAVLEVTVEGEPGDRVFVLSSFAPGFFFEKALTGTWLVPFARFLTNAPGGTVPASGTLDLAVPVRDLPPSPAARALFLQLFVIDAQGARVLGGAWHAAVVERASLPDCNSNNVSDYLDVAEGVAGDCQGNFELDECEIANGTEEDCNHNGVPDGCDIAEGTSTDYNNNGVPDECEFAPRTWWVDASAPPGGDGSQGMPFQHIQDGIDAADHFDTVRIADGVYTGPRNRDLLVQGRDILIRSENGPDNCIVDCQGLGQGFVLSFGEAPRMAVEGVTVRNGTGNNGGGFSVTAVAARIEDCVIEDCFASSWGGGMYFSGSRGSRVAGCRISGNSVGSWGGGMSLLQSMLTVVDCEFVGNHSGHNGGGFHTSSPQTPGTMVVSHCVFRENTADTDGGGLHAGQTAFHDFVIDNCLFVGNSASTGGAVRMNDGSRISNSTFVDNGATLQGGAIKYFYNGSHSLTNSVLWNNSAPNGAQLFLQGASFAVHHVSYSDVMGGEAAVGMLGEPVLDWGVGNIDLDPLFADPDGPDDDPMTFGDNDYRLGPASPAVDAADNFAVPSDATDIDGDGNLGERVPFDLDFELRFRDDPGVPDTGNGSVPIVDMGSYERQ